MSEEELFSEKFEYWCHFAFLCVLAVFLSFFLWLVVDLIYSIIKNRKYRREETTVTCEACGSEAYVTDPDHEGCTECGHINEKENHDIT